MIDNKSSANENHPCFFTKRSNDARQKRKQKIEPTICYCTKNYISQELNFTNFAVFRIFREI